PVCSTSSDTLGDGCPANQSLFYQGTSALAVAIDDKNNLYISDPADERIREVSTNLSFPASAVGQTVQQTVALHFSKNDAPNATNGIVTGSNDFAVSGTPACTA